MTNIFPKLTVFENVRLAAQAVETTFNFWKDVMSMDDINGRVLEILEKLKLAEQKEVRAANLSHGLQRHLEIGIALACHPELLLLDEPTAGMTEEETEQMMELINEISKDLTIVLVEHDMKFVMTLSKKITVLHEGKVLAEGPPEEIRNNEDVQRVYLGKEEIGVAMLLKVDDIHTYYGFSYILQGVSFEVNQGEAVALLGRNGVGKTTTLRSIIGATPPKSGKIVFDGSNIAGLPPYQVVRKGIAIIPDTRRIIPNITVEENLLLAMLKDRNKDKRAAAISH